MKIKTHKNEKYENIKSKSSSKSMPLSSLSPQFWHKQLTCHRNWSKYVRRKCLWKICAAVN